MADFHLEGMQKRKYDRAASPESEFKVYEYTLIFFSRRDFLFAYQEDEGRQILPKVGSTLKGKNLL